MPPPATRERDKQHRFPGDLISHEVWLSSHCTLSDRDGQERLCARGLTVSHEAIRQWCRQWGQQSAHHRCHRRPRPGDTWHVDEVFLTRQGARHDLWRVVDQDDHVLAILGQRRRHTRAAQQCFRKLLKAVTSAPRGIMTDQRNSDGAAQRALLPGVAHRHSRSRNNRCAHAHRPTRQREDRRQGWKSARHTPRFLSAYGPRAQHCRPRRPLCSASANRRDMRNRFARWAAGTGPARAA
jgi:putative transposase